MKITLKKPSIYKRLASCGNPCIHYSAVNGTQSGDDCGLGHPIRKITTAKAGTDIGIPFLMPCKASPEAIVTCPDFDSKTDDELALEKRNMDAYISRMFRVFERAKGWKEKMVSNDVFTSKTDCPICGGKNTMNLSCAIDVNDHLSCYCTNCKMGFME